MSGMSNLCVEILDMALNGYEPEDIALMLEIPIGWVYEAQKMNEAEVLADVSEAQEWYDFDPMC